MPGARSLASNALGAGLAAALTLLASPARAQQATLVRGPYLQALLDTSVVVVWKTLEDTRGRVVCVEAGGGSVEVLEPEGFRSIHRVKVSGLSPGKVHSYSIFAEGELLASVTPGFRTSPAPGEGAIRVAVVGDSGEATKEQEAVAALVKELKPDLFLHAGDLDYLHGELDKSVFGPYREVLPHAGFYPCPGNHDVEFTWAEHFIPPAPMEAPHEAGTYYSFDWGSAHFVALDTNIGFEPDSDQVFWLKGDLEEARKAGRPWLILYFHEMLYTVGSYSIPSLHDDVLARREVIAPLADRFGVDLIICGHDHNYQRTHPISLGAARDAWQSPRFISPRGAIQVITGGGGREELYDQEPEVADLPFMERFVKAFHAVELEITGTRLTVRAISPIPERKVIDEFTIVKEGPRPGLEFIRGDVDRNGRLQVTDLVGIIGHLFLGEPIDCPAVADLDRSGLPLQVTDPIVLIDHLFFGGGPPPPPFPDCGPDPAADDAWCLKTGCRP